MRAAEGQPALPPYSRGMPMMRSRYHLMRGRKARGPVRINEVVVVHSSDRFGPRLKVRRPDLYEANLADIGAEWLKAHRDWDGADCLVYPWAKRGPRATVRFNYREMSAARAMCLLVHGTPPEAGMMALHSCGHGDLSCVHPKHVYWGTHADNMADMARHGSLKGELAPNAKLTDAQVLDIWMDLKRGRSCAALADQYGVSERTIEGIRDGKSWAWLTLGGGREEFRKPIAPVDQSRYQQLREIADFQRERLAVVGRWPEKP